MFTRIRMNFLGAILALPLSLWLASHAFGCCGFDKPPLPGNMAGPSVIGTVVYDLSSGKNMVSFNGVCKPEKTQILFGPEDFSGITDSIAFATATGKQVGDVLEGLFLNTPSILSAFQPCYGRLSPYLGVVTAAVTKTTEKTAIRWEAEVVILGVTN